jgi:hypothetical protein
MLQIPRSNVVPTLAETSKCDVRYFELFFVPTGKCRYLNNGATDPSEPGPHHYRGFMVTLRHTTLSRTPLDELLARRRDLYLKINNIYETYFHATAGFEFAIPANELAQIHALDRAANGTGQLLV